MKAKMLTVIFVLSFLKIAHASPPQEIVDQLVRRGQVHHHQMILYDHKIENVIFTQHGVFYAITYAKWNGNRWTFEMSDVQMVFIEIDKKPHVLWSRSTPP